MSWKCMIDGAHLKDMGVEGVDVIHWGHAKEQWSAYGKQNRGWLGQGQEGRREEKDTIERIHCCDDNRGHIGEKLEQTTRGYPAFLGQATVKPQMTVASS